jgi:hypothetical protein
MPNKKESEDRELHYQTCGALLLQFKKPKVYDLSIPDDNEIYFLVATAGKIMKREISCPEKAEFKSVIGNPLKEEYFDCFSPRVSKGLTDILDKSTGNSLLYFYMRQMRENLSSEWNTGAGTWFRFREGKREEVEKEVKSYFNESELADFDKLGETFAPYVGMLNLINYSRSN